MRFDFLGNRKSRSRKELSSLPHSSLSSLAAPSEEEPRSLGAANEPVFEQMEADSDATAENFADDSQNNADVASLNKEITATDYQSKASSVKSAEVLQDIQNNGTPNTVAQENEIVIEDLDIEILEAIGNRVAEDRVLAPPIPKSIAVRLEDIIKKGLPKEEREKLIKEHAPPKNCLFFDPPKLNEEVKVSVTETSQKRDERIIEKQKKITACLALMGSAIVDIIKDIKVDKEKLSLIKKISEASRLLADLQKDETVTRRKVILAVINSSQKEVLETSTTDEWLFGQKLGDRLKAAKSIERSSKDLKVKPKNMKRPKNFKAPPRRQPFKPRMSGGYRNKGYNRNQPNRKNWANQNEEDRNNSQSQSVAPQTKS